MSDKRLRTLQRDQSTEGQARWLRERIRHAERSVIPCKTCEWDGSDTVSSVSPFLSDPRQCPACDGTGFRPLRDGVGLAAYCGDESSRLVADEATVVGSQHAYKRYRQIDGDGLGYWLSGLSRWGQATLVRAAVAAARAVLPAWEAEQDKIEGRAIPGHSLLPRQAIEVAERWLADPSEANRKAWSRAASDPDVPLWVPIPLRPGCTDIGAAASQMTLAATVATEPAVRAAICAALIPFALGDK